MKKFTLILLYFFSALIVIAQKKGPATFIGFQAGIIAPVNHSSYAIPKYKMGLPSFSYSASIENRFTINYKLNFSLQYSISYFNIMQKNLEKHIADYEAKQQLQIEKASKFNSNFSLNSIYQVNKYFGLVGGVGLSKPINFMENNPDRKKALVSDITSKYNNKFTPTLNPFFIIGIENSCTVFRRNLIYSIQYNIGFLPNKNLQMQESTNQTENKYMHGVNIGVKYKY